MQIAVGKSSGGSSRVITVMIVRVPSTKVVDMRTMRTSDQTQSTQSWEGAR